jgi:hypothetical protein
MEKRSLGEQWVEEIDGKRHMVKAVKQTNKCSGCIFCTLYWCGDPIQSEREFDCSTMIIKDLGILNEDGCLPSPWGGYPKIVRVGREGFCTYKVRFYLKHGIVYGFTLIEVTGNTRQQAIDAWNRRV